MITTLIVAMDESRCLWKDGQFAWTNKDERKHFDEVTKDHVVIMGRKTFEYLGKALPHRRNIVLSQNIESLKWAEVFESIEACYASFESLDIGRVFVVGWAQLYAQFIEQDLADEIWISHVSGTFEGDVYFPYYENRFEPFYEKQLKTFDFVKYRRINSRISSSKWKIQ